MANGAAVHGLPPGNTHASSPPGGRRTLRSDVRAPGHRRAGSCRVDPCDVRPPAELPEPVQSSYVDRIHGGRCAGAARTFTRPRQGRSMSPVRVRPSGQGGRSACGRAADARNLRSAFRWNRPGQRRLPLPPPVRRFGADEDDAFAQVSRWCGSATHRRRRRWPDSRRNPGRRAGGRGTGFSSVSRTEGIALEPLLDFGVIFV